MRIHFYHCCGKTHISHYTKSLPVVVGSSFNQLCAVHVWLGLVILFRRGFMCFKKTQMKRGKLFARVQISLNPIPNWSVLIQRPTDDGDGGVDGKHVSESIAIEWPTLDQRLKPNAGKGKILIYVAVGIKVFRFWCRMKTSCARQVQGEISQEIHRFTLVLM